jgi:hypothetical protein
MMSRIFDSTWELARTPRSWAPARRSVRRLRPVLRSGPCCSTRRLRPGRTRRPSALPDRHLAGHRTEHPHRGQAGTISPGRLIRRTGARQRTGRMSAEYVAATSFRQAMHGAAGLPQGHTPDGVCPRVDAFVVRQEPHTWQTFGKAPVSHLCDRKYQAPLSAIPPFCDNHQPWMPAGPYQSEGYRQTPEKLVLLPRFNIERAGLLAPIHEQVMLPECQSGSALLQLHRRPCPPVSSQTQRSPTGQAQATCRA